MHRRSAGVVAVLGLGVLAAACLPLPKQPPPPPPPPPTTPPPGLPGFSNPLWNSPTLDGIVQSRPVYAVTQHGVVIVVATEHDSVYGLDPHNGQILWGPVSIGTAEPLADIQSFPNLGGCGNLDPLGITSNLVVDAGNVYAVGEREKNPAGGSPHTPEHVFVSINPDPTAAQHITFAPTVIDVAGMNEIASQQQRAGLVAANGKVYVGFGGLAGDCGDYHGWVVAVNESDGSVASSFQVAPDVGAPHNKYGAVWATSGPVADGAGNVYASTGNGTNGLFNTPPGTDYSDAVVKLSQSGSTLTPADYFQPTTWVQDNASDADLGSTGPLFVSSGTQIFQLGKRGTAYLLDAANLGGANHETPVFTLPNVCPAWGSNAALANTVYTGCLTSTLRQVVISGSGSGATMSVGWIASVHANGPVTTDPTTNRVWSVDITNSVLYGFDAASGQVVVRAQLALNGQQHFATPRIGYGILLVENNQQVSAYAA